MTQQLKVTAIQDSLIQVSAEPVRSFTGSKTRSFWIPNKPELKLTPGSWVEVFFPSSRGLLDVFLLLMLPILLMVTIGFLLPQSLPQSQQILYSLLGIPTGIGIFSLSQKILPKIEPEILRAVFPPKSGLTSGCGTGCVCKAITVDSP